MVSPTVRPTGIVVEEEEVVAWGISGSMLAAILGGVFVGYNGVGVLCVLGLSEGVEFEYV